MAASVSRRYAAQTLCSNYDQLLHLDAQRNNYLCPVMSPPERWGLRDGLLLVQIEREQSISALRAASQFAP